jgi:hypothetical protein
MTTVKNITGLLAPGSTGVNHGTLPYYHTHPNFKYNFKYINSHCTGWHRCPPDYQDCIVDGNCYGNVMLTACLFFCYIFQAETVHK